MKLTLHGKIDRVFDFTKYLYLPTALAAAAGSIKSFFFRHEPKSITFEPWEIGIILLLIMLWSIEKFRKEIKSK